MPEGCCFKLSDKATFDEAAISEPLAIGVYAVKQSIPMQGAKVGDGGFLRSLRNPFLDRRSYPRVRLGRCLRSR